MQEAITSALKEANPTAQISHIAHILQIPKPLFFNQPNLARVPTILVTEAGKWDILRGKNSHGEWVCESFDQQEGSWNEQTLVNVQGHCLVKIQLSAPFTASKSPVYKLIKNEVFSHKRLLLEALLASITINIVALATAFYTMQGYNFRNNSLI